MLEGAERAEVGRELAVQEGLGGPCGTETRTQLDLKQGGLCAEQQLFFDFSEFEVEAGLLLGGAEEEARARRFGLASAAKRKHSDYYYKR